MNSVVLHEGDNRRSLRRLIDAGVRVHTVLTDPPYGLTSIIKRFGKQGAAPARLENNDGSFARLSGGFMGKEWDGTGIEHDPDFWALIYEILLPGGYVFAFSHPRTGHWQACAMELAGFIMHPFHGWVNAQSFPKGHDVPKAMAKHLKDELTIEAIEWAGYAYGTQTQKIALEPIYLGQKPCSEKSVPANLLKHGTGAFNIDDCRVPLNGDYKAKPNGRPSVTGLNDNYDPQNANQADTVGRWPANLFHDGSPEAVALFPNSKGAQGNVKGTEPSGVTKSICGRFKGRVPQVARSDGNGSAARFFHEFAPTEEDYLWAIKFGIIGCPSNTIPPFFFNSKAGKSDKDGSHHPTVKPISLLRQLVRHITPPGGIVLDPFAGSGTTAEACKREGFDCVLMEAEPDYIEFLRQRFSIFDELDILLGAQPPDELDMLLSKKCS